MKIDLILLKRIWEERRREIERQRDWKSGMKNCKDAQQWNIICRLPSWPETLHNYLFQCLKPISLFLLKKKTIECINIERFCNSCQASGSEFNLWANKFKNWILDVGWMLDTMKTALSGCLFVCLFVCLVYSLSFSFSFYSFYSISIFSYTLRWWSADNVIMFFLFIRADGIILCGGFGCRRWA